MTGAAVAAELLFCEGIAAKDDFRSRNYHMNDRQIVGDRMAIILTVQ